MVSNANFISFLFQESFFVSSRIKSNASLEEFSFKVSISRLSSSIIFRNSSRCSLVTIVSLRISPVVIFPVVTLPLPKFAITAFMSLSLDFMNSNFLQLYFMLSYPIQPSVYCKA